MGAQRVRHNLATEQQQRCRGINCKEGAPLVEDVNNREDYACVGAEGIWEIFVLSSLFYCELKIAFKKPKVIARETQ